MRIAGGRLSRPLTQYPRRPTVTSMPDTRELWGFAALTGAGMLIYVISRGPLGLAFAAAFIIGASVIWERIRPESFRASRWSSCGPLDSPWSRS